MMLPPVRLRRKATLSAQFFPQYGILLSSSKFFVVFPLSLADVFVA